MGSFAYCDKCDQGVPEPTLKEALMQSWECPHCGASQHVQGFMKEQVLETLENRINALETLIKEYCDETGKNFNLY